MRQNIAFGVSSFLIVLAACGDNKSNAPAGPPPAVKVLVAPVKVADAVFNDEYPGTVTALNQVDLRPQVTGFISAINFKDGDRVKKGQLLYAIDAQLYAANYQQAVAGARVQDANLIRAQKDADRYHELDKKDAVAKQLVDNADAALEVAKKQSDAAKANIDAVATNVRYTKVYAPFDGVIGISLVKPGTAVTAGQTVLNTVSTDNELAVDFNVDQKEIFRFTDLMKRKDLHDSTFTIALGTNVYPVPGRLAFLDRAVDPQTGTIKARLIFADKQRALRAGMNVTVRVRNASGRAVMIPFKAITEQLGEFFVYVPGDSNKVSQRKVTYGQQIGKDVIVTTGLKEGDSVVMEGVQNLKEGTVIQSVAASPDGTGSAGQAAPDTTVSVQPAAAARKQGDSTKK